jgi:hypothetical protein
MWPELSLQDWEEDKLLVLNRKRIILLKEDASKEVLQVLYLSHYGQVKSKKTASRIGFG